MIIKKYFKLIFYNILITFIIILTLLLLIFFTEVVTGRYFSKNKIDCAYVLCNADYKYINRSREAVLQKKYEVYYDIIYQKDEYGFRGRSKDVSKIDILTVGGSTTDEKFLNVEDTWSHKLEKKFQDFEKKVDVVSAGIDGQSSHGHIWSLKNWFPKVKNLKTTYIIFYMGINENLKNKSDTIFDLQIENLSVKKKVKYYIQRNNGFLYKIYNILAKKYYNLYMNQGYEILFPKYTKTKNKFTPNQDQKNYLINNLAEIKELTTKLNAIPIFVTQRSQYWKNIDGKILLANNYIYNDKDYYNFEKFIAEIIIDFCKENNILCIDIFKNIKFDIEDHFELAHTTAKGSQKIADYIFEKLNENYKF
jgi:hypothetical protein